MNKNLIKLKNKLPFLKKRDLFLRLVRKFFYSKHFFEIDSPLLLKSPCMEPHLDPFQVKGTFSGTEYFLPTSPEFYLKKILSLGEDKIFSLSPSFRDEEKSKSHSHQFLMLEWYRENSSLEEIAKDIEELLCFIKKNFPFEPIINANGKEIRFDQGFNWIELNNFFEEMFGMPFTEIKSLNEWHQIAEANGAQTSELWDENDCFSYLMVSKVERKLNEFEKPVILYGYPQFQSALAEVKDGISQRFELYINGIELANAYNELKGKEKNIQRYKEFQKERVKLKKKILPQDEELFDAVENFNSPAGIAFGIDRFLSLILNCSIDECQNG